MKEIVIKPHLEELFRLVMQNRGGVVAATKREFIEKTQKAKATPIRVLCEGARGFLEKRFSLLI